MSLIILIFSMIKVHNQKNKLNQKQNLIKILDMIHLNHSNPVFKQENLIQKMKRYRK